MNRGIALRVSTLTAAGVSEADAAVIAAGEHYQQLVVRDGFTRTAQRFGATPVMAAIKHMNALKSAE